MEKAKITFIGLGNMGIGMAQNLLNAGYQLNVYNRTKNKSEALKGDFQSFEQPDKAAEGQDIIITMLSDDEALFEATNGENGFLSRMKKDAIHISMSTISPDTSRELYKTHKEQGSHYVTAPVFGRPNAAAGAKLFICTSGDTETKEKVNPVLDLLGQGTYDFGTEPGAANVVKLAGNFMMVFCIKDLCE